MISVSFYLLTPEARFKSVVYVSVSNKVKRLRFSTGKEFRTASCNIRKRKGRKGLLKSGSENYLEYKKDLETIENTLTGIEDSFIKKGIKPTLQQIKGEYHKQVGTDIDNNEITLSIAYNKFMGAKSGRWSDGTKRIYVRILSHMIEFQEDFGEINMNNLNEDFWVKFRDNYYVKKKGDKNSSINTMLKKLKEFIKYAYKKEFIKCKIDFDELTSLDEIPNYKISLKLKEVEDLFNLNLSNDHRLEKVRDLFFLEILTGQRFSDIPKLLDKRNISKTSIHFNQEKTNKRITIPLHPKLREYLPYIFNKYPQKLPMVSNAEFNRIIKEIGKLAGFNSMHQWVTKSGNKKKKHSDFRYNLISSHTGRRTFCTLSKKAAPPISDIEIMTITGHTNLKAFNEYVRVDDDDINNSYNNFLMKK